MGDMNPLLQKQREIQEFKQVQQEQQTTQQSTMQTQQQQTQTQQQTEDMMAVQQTIQANAYLQNERDDADAAAPDEARDELLMRQATIGLGKRVGMNDAHDAAQG